MIRKHDPFILQISKKKKKGSGKLSNLSKVTQQIKLIIMYQLSVISKYHIHLQRNNGYYFHYPKELVTSKRGIFCYLHPHLVP